MKEIKPVGRFSGEWGEHFHLC